MFLHPPSSLRGPFHPGPWRRSRKRSRKTRLRLFVAPEIRTELVERIRAEIADGTYDTPAKLSAAIEKMLGYLRGD